MKLKIDGEHLISSNLYGTVTEISVYGYGARGRVGSAVFELSRLPFRKMRGKI